MQVEGSVTDVVRTFAISFVVSVESIVFVSSFFAYYWGVRDIQVLSTASRYLGIWQLGLPMFLIGVYIKIAMPYLRVRSLPEKLQNWQDILLIRWSIYAGLVWVVVFGLGFVVLAASIMNGKWVNQTIFLLACVIGQIVSVFGVWNLDQRVESRVVN